MPTQPPGPTSFTFLVATATAFVSTSRCRVAATPWQRRGRRQRQRTHPTPNPQLTHPTAHAGRGVQAMHRMLWPRLLIRMLCPPHTNGQSTAFSHPLRPRSSSSSSQQDVHPQPATVGTQSPIHVPVCRWDSGLWFPPAGASFDRSTCHNCTSFHAQHSAAAPLGRARQPVSLPQPHTAQRGCPGAGGGDSRAGCRVRPLFGQLQVTITTPGSLCTLRGAASLGRVHWLLFIGPLFCVHCPVKSSCTPVSLRTTCHQKLHGSRQPQPPGGPVVPVVVLPPAAQLGSSPAWVQQMSCRAHATPRVHGGCGRLPCEAAARQLPWGCMAGGAVSCRRPWRPRCVLHATPRRQECPGCAACGGLLPLPCSLEMPAGRPQQAPLPPLGAGTGGGAGHPSPARAPRRTGAGWVAAAWLPGGAPALGRARPGGQLQHPGMHSPVLFPRGCRAACRCPCMPAATPVLPARPPARPGTFALPPVIASPPNASLTPASQPAACRHTAAPVSPSQC